MRIVGRPVDSDSSLVTKKWSDDTYQTVKVDASYVNSQVTAEITNNALQTQVYVDQRDALRAHKSDVDAADNTYLATTTLNAINGVAGLDSSGNLFTAQVPAGVVTERVARFYPTSAVYLAPGATHTVTTNSLREFKIADVAVSDPGYSWLPLPFASIQGYSTAQSAPPGRDKGTGTTGRLVVMAPSPDERVYAAGAATCAYNMLATYVVHPHGASGDTPQTVPALTGAKTFSLYASCHTGSGYLFRGDALVFHILVLPAM